MNILSIDFMNSEQRQHTLAEPYGFGTIGETFELNSLGVMARPCHKVMLKFRQVFRVWAAGE